MEVLKDVISALLGDASPEERARLLRLAYRVSVTIALFWAYGLLNPLGIQGFAKANTVDEKVQAAIEPLRSELGKVAVAVASQDEVLKAIRIDQIATKLRELKRAYCLATTDSDVRERMEREIDMAQREYRTFTGERYPLPECGK